MRPIHLTLSHPIPKEDPMTEFAHEYASHDGAAAEFRIREGAASTLILHRADGTVDHRRFRAGRLIAVA